MSSATSSRGRISTTKNGKVRKVDISAKLTEVLKDMLSKWRAEAFDDEIRKPAGERVGKNAIEASINTG